jgi:ABC-type dipeptide/oligopeptide/nickel transport system permease subunit
MSASVVVQAPLPTTGPGPLPRPRASAHPNWATRLLRRRPAALASVLLAIIFFAALAAPLIAPYDPLAMHPAQRFSGPTANYWLGTDETGRDLLTRILFGARVSVLVGLGAVALSFAAGGPLGMLAGYRGGRTESIVMGFMDVLLAIPGLLLALTLVATLGPSTVNATIAIGCMGIPSVARLTRAVVMIERARDYVLSARAIGANDVRIAARAILPNCLAPLIIQASLTMASAILIEAALSYVGLGVQPPWASLGSLLYTAYGYISRSASYVAFPGLTIFITVWSLNLLGDGLRDVLDPRLRGL